MLAFAVVTAACGSKPPVTPPSNTVSDRPVVTGDSSKADHPGNSYKAKTWIEKLEDPRESERAVTMLEQLGDPSAITALGEAWAVQGKPVRMLQVIISLARPLTPEEAKASSLVDYEASGRPASWDRALPFLIRALTEVDEANPRSVDSALKAADALGEAKLPGGLDALIEIASKPVTKKLIAAQVAAIRALGEQTGDKRKASAALVEIIDREPPPHPRTAADKAQHRTLEERYALFLGSSGAAINALGDLRVPSATRPLVLALYRTPELFTQIRRALVASGPSAEQELLKVLRGESAEVNQRFKDKRLDRYCGDKGEAPPERCQPVSAKDFYAAVVLGDFFDPAIAPDLLTALKRPAAPVYFLDDQPSPNTQYNAVFDALRKIGAAEAAAPVRAMWMAGKTADLTTKILAVGAYPFLTRDGAGSDKLGKIAADNTADDTLRQEAATAFARLARDPKDIALLQGLAKRYVDASAAKTKEAAGKQQDAAAADRALETQEQALARSKADLQQITHDSAKTAQEIHAASAATKKLEDAFRIAKKQHHDQVAPYRSLASAAKAYQGYARMFQTHIARIEIARRCKADLPCYAASLALTPDQAAANNATYIPDIHDWSTDEKQKLVAAAIDRAMLEIGKQGASASQLTETLLDAAASDVRSIRQSVLLALPRIAKLPCTRCEAKLDAAVRAGEGKPTLADLNLETTMMRTYFSWAGGKPQSEPDAK
jgi:hypothetical protein